MKKVNLMLLFIITSLTLMSLIVRDDVPDNQFILLGKKYPQICHLANGEATLIKENWLVTAAHVAVFFQEEMDKGKTAEVIIKNEKYDIQKIKVHPKFKMSKTGIKNDIALIQIKGSITDIPLAKLYDQRDEVDKEIVLVGRGYLGTGKTGPQKWDKITRAATNRIDKVDKQWIIFDFDAPESKKITKLEGVSGPGDSGGPAFIDVDGTRYIVGVSSNQNTTREEGLYGVIEYYTRISSFKKWIEESVK